MDHLLQQITILYKNLKMLQISKSGNLLNILPVYAFEHIRTKHLSISSKKFKYMFLKNHYP